MGNESITWLRNNAPKVKNVDDPAYEALARVANIPLTKDMQQGKKRQAIKESIQWIRKNDPKNLSDIDEPTLLAFTKLAGVPMPDHPLTEKERRLEAIENSLGWLRNNDPKLEDVDKHTAKSFAKLSGIPLPRKLTRENITKTMQDAINWLRKADAEDLLHADDKNLQALTKLAGISLPLRSKTNQTKKAEMIHDSINWLRKNSPKLEDIDNPTLETLAKLANINISGKELPEEKQKALNQTINWIRNSDPKKLEDVDENTLLSISK